MNGIIIDIDPVLLQIGHLQLRWYSVIILIAAAVGGLVSIREAKRKGIPAGEISSLLPWLLGGGLVGGRLFHVFDQWSHYVANPGLIIQFQQGGLAIWGSLAGGSLAAIIYARSRHIPVIRLVEALVPGMLVAQIIGRFACIINGDAYGGVTDLPWGFIYVNPGAHIPANLAGVPTHPYPVYEMLWNGLSLLAILKLRLRFTQDGLTFLSYLSFYSVGRFLLTFIRQERVLLLGLQQAQLVAIVIFVVSVGLMLYLTRMRRVPQEVLGGGQP